MRTAERCMATRLGDSAEDGCRGASAFEWVGLFVFDDAPQCGEGGGSRLGPSELFTSCDEGRESIEALCDAGSLEEVEEVERREAEAVGEGEWVEVEADELGENGFGVGLFGLFRLHGGHGNAGLVRGKREVCMSPSWRTDGDMRAGMWVWRASGAICARADGAGVGFEGRLECGAGG